MEANVLTTGLLAKTKPEVIDSLNNGQGTFLYNHNIKEVKVIADKEGGIEITTDAERATGTMFQYDSVRVEYPKTADNIFSTLLTARYPATGAPTFHPDPLYTCIYKKKTLKYVLRDFSPGFRGAAPHGVFSRSSGTLSSWTSWW